MRTVSVIGRKGGSGKTTIASQLAIGFHLRGRKTILADLDPQLSSTEVLGNRKGEGPEPIESDGPRLHGLKAAAKESGADVLLVDTPAVLEEAAAHAVALSDLCLLVLRPTFLDLASAIRTSDIIRTFRKPGLIVLNQAPASREAVESPIVRRSMEALRLLRLPVAPVIVRARAVYQYALESGHSAEELTTDVLAAEEIAALCSYVDRFLFGDRKPPAPAPAPAVDAAAFDGGGEDASGPSG